VLYAQCSIRRLFFKIQDSDSNFKRRSTKHNKRKCFADTSSAYCLFKLSTRVYSGTTELTLADFWRMVWQQCCGKIVMLTNLDEGDTVWI